MHAVAARAGYGTAIPLPDDDSIDWVILGTGANGTPRRPRLEVQLKCTARSVLQPTDLHFPLELKNYNDLRITNILVPRILLVMTIPDLLPDWLAQSEQEMALRHCLYWASLRGMPTTTNQSNVTIYIPRTQVFTPDELHQMMLRIDKGGLP